MGVAAGDDAGVAVSAGDDAGDVVGISFAAAVGAGVGIGMGTETRIAFIVEAVWPRRFRTVSRTHFVPAR